MPNHDVPFLLLDQLKQIKRVAAFAYCHGSQAVAQQVLEATPENGVVIRDQYFEHLVPLSYASWHRKRKVTVVPFPGQPAMSSEPPMPIERSLMPRSPNDAASLILS